MPEIADVAKHYNDIPVTDGYSGAALFNAQLLPLSQVGSGGAILEHRVITVAPGTSIPSRRVVVALGEMVLIGSGVTEGIYGSALRVEYWTRRITDSFTKFTPGAAALAGSGTAFYGQKNYFKNTSAQSSSELDSYWNVYANPGEALADGQILTVGSTYYRVRTTHADLAGYTIAECDELDSGARVSVAFNTTGTYDPVTDTYAGGTTTVYGILMDRYKWYDLLTPSDKPTLDGDMTLVVATSSITPVIGKTVTIASRVWQILNVTAVSDAWEIHLRRA